MAIYRGPGGTGDSTANASGDAAIASTAAANAAASAAAAASSASSAGVDAGTAQNAAANAANSQTAAATSAGNAATSATSASNSATSASTSATAAALSETNTATLYDNFDDRYLGVKTTSPATDNDGNTLQTGALYFNSTTNDMFVWTGSLWTTVSNTTTSTNAATSAAAALASQNAASTSESNAATSATNASNSASTASTQASNASSSASAASTSASNASSSASSASSSASTATTQASNASTSATNAASSASAASTSASNAATSASNASTSATNAASSATSAAASYDSFDDRYLGAKSSAPTLDNDGNALLTGAIYWSTSVNSLYVWDGIAWLPAAFSSAGNVTSFNTRTGAITLTSSDVTTALTYTPLNPASNLSDLASAPTARTNLGLGSIATQNSSNVSITGGAIAVTANPSNALDVATKQYVDAAVSNLHIHQAVAAATTAALSGTVTYDNGTSGIGATLTLGTALTTLDGYTLVNGDRVLIKNQTNAAHNGVYNWATGGTVLTRSTTSDETVELNGGDFFFVVHGTVNGDTGWVVISAVTTIGTSDINFTQFSGAGTYTAGAGLTLTGSVFSVDSTSYSNWNTAYGWGNHASAGYLTSYTETDPVYTASSWYSTTNNSSNWNTAYGWGNHASAGYLTTATASSTYLTQTNAASTYQPLDADLTAIAALSPTADNFIVGSGSAWILETPAQVRTSLGLVIGTNVQAYNANTVFTNAEQTFTDAQRGAVTTDNDLSFDLSVGNNFSCTPTGTGALTFTNHTAGQSGYVLLINTGGHAITAAATTKVGTAFLTTVSTAGTYLISYFDNGTNAYCTASGALA
jgi:hypothetical protein